MTKGPMLLSLADTRSSFNVNAITIPCPPSSGMFIPIENAQ